MKIPAILTSAMLVLTALSAGAQSIAIEHKKTTFTLAEAQVYAICNGTPPARRGHFLYQ